MRHIQLTIQGSRVAVGAGDPCVAGEGNSTGLLVTFDPGWDGLTKTAVFWDARGLNPVRRILTADLLASPDTDTRTYLVPIPAEPLALAGDVTLIFDGAGEGVRLRTLPVELAVADAPDGGDAAEPADPTPTQAEQLQVQIDTVLDRVAGAIAAGEQAVLAAERAESAAGDAQGYTSHPPVIGDGGTWQSWDGTAYTDTGLPSRGETGDTGPQGEPGPQGEQGPQGEPGELTSQQGNALYANALKGSASGTAIRLDDVSPLEHHVAVRVSGVDDPELVTVYGGGVNLYDDAAKTTGANIAFGAEAADANTNLSDYFVVPPNATIQISLANRWAFYDAEKNVLAYVTNSATVPRTVVVPSNACYMRLSYHTVVTAGNPTNISDGSDIMAVVGTKLPAAYYPFTQGLSAYPAAGDGTCQVTSVSPTMTLLTDTEGAVMECEYNKDINKAYDTLVQAIVSLGGEM